MEKALTVESMSLIEDVASKVINRDDDTIYDGVIVTKNGAYVGIVMVHHILERITAQKISLAMQANPLSGLPGNNMIKEEIEFRLKNDQSFAVLYFDLDNFKPFNDNFGFDQGDKVIYFVGSLIKDILSSWDIGGFVGHIGGDDFVSVTKISDVETLCEKILQQFSSDVIGFHDTKSVKKGFYLSKNRNGTQQQFPLLSLSIAVIRNHCRKYSSYAQLVSVAGELKKQAKKRSGNSYFIDKRRQ